MSTLKTRDTQPPDYDVLTAQIAEGCAHLGRLAERACTSTRIDLESISTTVQGLTRTLRLLRALTGADND